MKSCRTLKKSMGRSRTINKKFPPHFHQSGNNYYFVSSKLPRRWVNLGQDYRLALTEWASLASSGGDTGTIKSAIEHYKIHELPAQAKNSQIQRGYLLKQIDLIFGHMKYSQLRTVHVNQYLRTKKAKVAANHEITLLSTIFRYAINNGWTDHNPCVGVKMNKVKKRERYITDLELQELRNHASDSMRCMIDLAYLTAMRRGDILALKLSDISEQGIQVKQLKTSKKQLFKWSTALREVIARAKKARKTRNITYLFTSEHGSQLTDSGFNSAFQRLKRKIGIKDTHFHDVRSKSITDAKRLKGLDYAQALAGHANQSMTEHYIKQREITTVEPWK